MRRRKELKEDRDFNLNAPAKRPLTGRAGAQSGAAVAAGSVALLGVGLDSGIEAIASIIVIWRFPGSGCPLSGAPTVAVTFPTRAIHRRRGDPALSGDRAETSISGSC